MRARYQKGVPFTPGRQYFRKDAVRLLHWPKNSSSTVYGQRIEATTKTCLMFVTLHKADDVDASTAYEDKLLDRSTMLWYTQSRKKLESSDVAQIVSNQLDLHVFVKKSDVDGSQHYYLGKPHVDRAEQTQMLDKDGDALPVVRTYLRFETPIEAGLFDYFEPTLT